MRRYVNPKLFFLFYIFSLHWLYSIYVKQFPLRETSTKALGRLLLYRAQVDPPDTLLYKDVLSLLVSSTHDESSEVRRRALSAIKAVAKVCAWSVFTLYLDTTCIIILPKFYASLTETFQANPSAIMLHGTIVGPAIAECLKDASTPVRLAAERCAVHALQLTKGTFICILLLSQQSTYILLTSKWSSESSFEIFK